MISLISNKIEEIAGICRQLSVRRLDVFGSAVNGDFDYGQSDVDFVVEFVDHSSPGILVRYLALAEGLESVLNKRVDLVTKESIQNPIFRKSIESSKEAVYES